MKLRTRILALVMALLVAVTSPLQAFAEGEAANQAGSYLEDVYVAVAKTPDEAAKVLDQKGYAVLKGGDGKPADLNQGANSALKKDAAVVLGYKTTDDRAKAITDLAVMNMEGGYSFVSYAEKMNEYRDSTIKPFINRFMATVKEYRANAESQDTGIRAKAEFVRSMLNRIVEDDTGKYLGDLLLQPTRAEMGDAYNSLSEEQKKEHIDLERALMQGNAQIVYQAEQLLSYAADTAETTWLERLSSTGASVLDAQYADMRPSDVRNEQSSRYQELAKTFAQGWDDMRDKLLQCDLEYSDAPVEDATTEGVDQGSSYAQPQVELGVESDQPIEVVDSPGQSQSGLDTMVQEGQDEIDIADRLRLEVPDLESDPKEVTPDDVPELLNEAASSLEDMNEASDDIDNTNAAALYFFLKSLPYEEGTLYDLFTLPASEVTGDNISKLYPAVSCLSAGQAAAIEFLPLPTLLQIGATTGDAYATMWVDGLGLKELAESSGEVSLYQGVDRSIFTDLTALTSDALRLDALNRENSDKTDFFSEHKISLILWTGTVVSTVFAGASVYKALKETKQMEQKIEDMNRLLKRYDNTQYYLNDMISRLPSTSINTKKVHTITISPVSNEMRTNRKWWKVEISRTRGLTDAEKQLAFESARGRSVGSYEQISQRVDLIGDEGNLNIGALNDQIEEYKKQKTTDTITKYFSKNSGLEEGSMDFRTQIQKFKDKTDSINKTKKRLRVSWVAPTVWGIISIGLTVASIVSTVRDIVAYYNVKYAPMPGYIVDLADITTTADDGKTKVVRNDTAYYSAVLTNTIRKGDDLSAMLNYADLNGDKGKQWLGLYSAKTDGDPILASSLKVVTGTSSVPDGYSTGIHMFGSDAAINLTDERYCYNDKANGVYAYFKREAAAPTAASVFASGSTVLMGGLCLVAGAALGAGGMYLACRRRREPATA